MSRRSDIRNNSAPDRSLDDHVSVHRHYGKAVVGLGVLAVGVLMTLDNLDIVETDRLLDYWPVLLILLGVAHLVQPPPGRRLVSGTIWILVGALLLLYMLDLVNFNPFDLWPLVLVLAGCSMLVRAFRRGRPVPPDTGSDFDANNPSAGQVSMIGAGGSSVLLRILNSVVVELDVDDEGDGFDPGDVTISSSWDELDAAADAL